MIDSCGTVHYQSTDLNVGGGGFKQRSKLPLDRLNGAHEPINNHATPLLIV